MGEIVNMIDLHAHILHGLDEGPETLSESLEMVWIGYRDAVRKMVGKEEAWKMVTEYPQAILNGQRPEVPMLGDWNGEGRLQSNSFQKRMNLIIYPVRKPRCLQRG